MKDERKQKARNVELEADRKSSSFILYHSSFPASCPACGAAIPRETARFCNVCGKLLLEEYQPLDNLRASYGLQGKAFDFKNDGRADENLFEENKNTAAQTAWACLVYSLVPYLGILFVPLTFGISSLGYFNAVRRPHLGGKQLSLSSFYLSFVVLAVQIFLWWLLYIVPKIPAL